MKNNKMKKNINRYLHHIKKALPLTHKNQKGIMKHFSKGLYGYCSEEKPVSMDMVYNEFGTAKQVTNELISETPPEQIAACFHRKRIVTYILFGLIILLLGCNITSHIIVKHHIPYNIETYIETKYDKIPNNEDQ